MKIYNTLSRTKEEFIPIKKGEVSIYTCGPTVYNHAHIGNLRSYVFADTLVRFLKYSGNRVNWVMNITDVDDKTIRDSKQEGRTLSEFTQKYEKLFFEDIEKLNIEKSSFLANPRATDTIPEMQKIILKLIDKNFAYISDGSIYFSIKKYIESGHKYGELVNIDMAGFIDGVRNDKDEYEKEDLKDFVLWKGKKEDDEPSWPFEVNGENLEGRPGWHIECSAMSQKFLGDTFDIHTGGVDLAFPHHEDEIAQSVGANGKGTFAKYFMHHEHLLVEGRKMSKSLHNFYTLVDIEKMIKNPLALRYLFLQSHYRSKLDFSEASLKSAQSTLEGIYYHIRNLKQVSSSDSTVDITDNLESSRKKIIEYLGDDLNTAKALAEMFDSLKMIMALHTKKNISKKQADQFLDFLNSIDELLGLGFSKVELQELSDWERKFLDKYIEARKNKDYKTSDAQREHLSHTGIEVEDTPEGTKWRRV